VSDLAIPQNTSISATSLITQGDTFIRVMELAAVMAGGVATIPKHLQKNQADCAAVVMQALQWNMNPFAVAQKTHLVNGVLGYEAQLVNAAITSIAPTKNRLNFEWFGDWSKIIGNFKELESRTKKDDDGHPKKYRVPAWDISAEKGLGVRVWATLKGENEPRALELLMTQARTRNSTLWVDDPKQQLAYLAIKRWARLHTPDVILGVYTPDELEQAEREINPEFANPKGNGEQDAPDIKEYPEEAFLKNFKKWKEAIEKGKASHQQWIDTLSQKGQLTQSQLDRINEVKAPIEGEAVEQ
jgi:hypothetical protein